MMLRNEGKNKDPEIREILEVVSKQEDMEGNCHSLIAWQNYYKTEDDSGFYVTHIAKVAGQNLGIIL